MKGGRVNFSVTASKDCKQGNIPDNKQQSMVPQSVLV